jgi:phage terminase large subunit
MDFGYTHAFAVVLMAVFGSKTFVIDSYELPELELQEQIGFCDVKIKPYLPEIYADPAYPAYIKTFTRHGYKMRSWKKGPGSVLTGISAIRSKLAPVIGEPELFLLKDDEGCEALYRDMAAYHWTLDVAGNPTDVPSEDGDDKIDALRYAIMNVFSQRGRILASHGDNVAFEETKKGPMQQFIEEALADSPSLETTGKKGRLGWSF